MSGKALEECVRRAGRVIALDGSSSRGLCIFRTGAVDAPYSGQTHPSHPASPGVSATKKQEITAAVTDGLIVQGGRFLHN